jgi:hypothetical protein
MSQAPEGSRAPLTSTQASLREVERRRGERLLITIPIRVEGEDSVGEKFREDTRTMVVSRQGARIRLKKPTAAGAVVLVSTAGGRRQARFRVVGPTQPLTPEGGEWGIECLESNCTLWGIGFPPPRAADRVSAALLECRGCHAVKITPLSLVEHEVLGLSGLLVKECEACGRSTSWSYRDPSTPIPVEDETHAPPGLAPEKEKEPGLTRAHGRVGLRLPIRVRSFRGAEEFSRSENLSRGGLCFVTDRDYEVGEVVLVTCPYEAGGQNIEVRSVVVRCQETQGMGRKRCGIRFER